MLEAQNDPSFTFHSISPLIYRLSQKSHVQILERCSGYKIIGQNAPNECSFKFSLLTSTVWGQGAYGPHKDINLKSVICPFNIGL